MKNKTYLFSFIFLCVSQVSLAEGRLSLVADNSRTADNSINSIIDTQKPTITSATNRSFERNEASLESKTNLFTFKTEYIEKPSTDWRNNILGSNNNDAAWGIRLDSTFFKVYGGLKNGKFRPYDPSKLSSYNDSDNKLMDLTLDGKLSFLNYGINYQKIGQDYSSLIKAKGKNIKKDSEGINYWVDRDIGNLNLKLNYSDMWDNVKLDPKKPQYNQKLMGLSSTYTISSWPYSSITLSYKFGDRKSTYVPSKKKPYSGSVNEISALFNLSYDNLDVSFGSTLGNQKNNNNKQDTTRSIAYYLNASFSPISSVYITPSISYSTDFIENTYSAYKYASVDQSVSIVYKPELSPLSVSYYISHSSYKGSDGSVDYATLNNQVSFQWVIHSNKKKASVLSFDIAQARNKDNIYSGSSYNDLFVGVGWTSSFD